MNQRYDISSFCEEFTSVYNLELDYNLLKEEERKGFKELAEMAARFSDDEEELKFPKIYVSEREIKDEARHIEGWGKNIGQ